MKVNPINHILNLKINIRDFKPPKKKQNKRRGKNKARGGVKFNRVISEYISKQFGGHSVALR